MKWSKTHHGENIMAKLLMLWTHRVSKCKVSKMLHGLWKMTMVKNR